MSTVRIVIARNAKLPAKVDREQFGAAVMEAVRETRRFTNVIAGRSEPGALIARIHVDEGTGHFGPEIGIRIVVSTEAGEEWNPRWRR